MLKRILDGRGPLVPLLGELGPLVLVVGPCGSMLGGLVHTFRVLGFQLILLVLSWISSRSSVDITVMSAPVLRRASTLRCRSMMMER